VSVVNGSSRNYLQRAPSPSGLADVIDVILDKGLVIDAYVRVSVIGIELLTIDARIVIASVDTYLRFAEEVNRLDLTQTEAAGLAELAYGDDDGGEPDEEEPDEAAGETTLRQAAKGAAAGAVVAGAAAAAKEIASRVRRPDETEERQ
jgi:gas vesicle structural protein